MFINSKSWFFFLTYKKKRKPISKCILQKKKQRFSGMVYRRVDIKRTAKRPKPTFFIWNVCMLNLQLIARY